MLSAILVLALALLAAAQSEPAVSSPPPDGRRPMGRMTRGLGDGIGAGPAVKGVPLSAQLDVNRDTTLADGNRIHTDTQTMIYRDSEGRVRREIQFELNTPTTGASRHTMIIITDPVAGYRYTLNPQSKVAHQMPLRGSKRQEADGSAATPERRERKLLNAGELKTEDLGTKTVAGLPAQGTRVTRTIPAGEIGNQNPINVVTERWYSQDLQLPVLTTHNDPLLGTVTSQLSNINRSEPAASLFQVPSDYKVESAKPGDMLNLSMHP